jgi:hypothetical protein
MHRGSRNSLQQACAGKIGAEGEILKRHRLRLVVAVTRNRAD